MLYSFLSFVLSSILWLIIVGVIIYIGRKIYRKYTVRKNTDNADTRDKNLPVFKNSFIDIQSAYGTAFNEANMSKLAVLCTTEMYEYFMLIKSENEEKGLTNIVKDINVISITTTKYIEDSFTGKIYHTAEIRFSMIDYTLDASDAVVDGDMYKADVDTEMWTFVSDDTKTWKLSAIEQYQA
jgi:predicted lipid-binding transport protein (Tim44 family)